MLSGIAEKLCVASVLPQWYNDRVSSPSPRSPPSSVLSLNVVGLSCPISKSCPPLRVQRQTSCSLQFLKCSVSTFSVEDEEAANAENDESCAFRNSDREESQHDARHVDEDHSLSLFCQLKTETNDERGNRSKNGQKKARQKNATSHIPDHLLQRVAIVGRPNVGKSALFNRLIKVNKAIVLDKPGITKDRLYGKCYWRGHIFLVIDTGGILNISKAQDVKIEELSITKTVGMKGMPLALMEKIAARMPSMIERQAALAMEEAIAVIFLVDGQVGLTATDVEIANWLRRNCSKKAVVLAVNKCESPQKGLLQVSEFWSLGFSPIPISAVTGAGVAELLGLVCAELKTFEEVETTDSYIPSVAIVGRPNVGKSSILNALLGEDRAIVSPISGTTSDTIDSEFSSKNGQKYRLIDTAGIRRRAAVASGGSMTEALSVERAFHAICRSDVVALVIEAMACVTEQDYKIAERVEREGKGCVIVVNKWDTIPCKNEKTTLYYEEDVRKKLRVLDWAPIVYVTAITGHSVERIISALNLVEKERSRRLSTSLMNQVVQEVVAFKAPPRSRCGRRGRLYYCTQVAIRPPTFVFFVNDTKYFPETYRRYMEKRLRSDAGFSGTPIRLLWRSRERMHEES